MRKKALAGLLAAALLLAALAGCGGGNGGTAQGGENTVVVGIATDLKTLDPGHMYEVFGNMYTYSVYDMLFRFEKDDTLAPKPSLVTDDWTLDDSRTVYTFPLRDDVTFASGNALTSADVLFTVNRIRNLKSNTIKYAEGIADITAPDEYTVVITLSEPDASFLTKLAANAFCILDSELVKQNGATDGLDAATADTGRDYLDQNSAGSGPYKLVSWTPNVELVLEKNEDYWGERGNVDRFIIKEIPDPNTQIQMVEKGEIDIAYTLSADNAGQLEGKEGVNIIRGRSSVISFLMMNQDPAIGGPVSDPDVQKAIRHAINYGELLELCGDGASLPLSFVPEGFTGALQRDTGYRDLDTARALLDSAGYPDGFEVTLTTATFDTEGMQWTTIAQKIQNDLAEIGINVKVATGEVGVVIDEYREGKTGFLVMHWSPDYLDINNQLAFVPGDVVGLRANWPAGSYPEMESLAGSIKVEADQSARASYSEELQRLMDEYGPYAFLLQHPKYYAAGSNLSNLYYNDMSKILLKDITVA